MMFTKILIANRGEIAIRVATTARRLGIRTVAVYSDVDANAAHVAACDEAVHVGAAAPKDSYLRGEAVIAAAKATGAQAIHPGYGFLSENAAFAQACTDAGLTFIGPPPAAIRAMGLKAESKRLMEAAGVPLVPGYHGTDQSPDALAKEAARIGFPVLIKASAGGGGKGMKPAYSAAEFPEALVSAKREAMAAFGNDHVLIEKYLQQPRHIEVQVFADTQGHCVYLFERDCSVQRRHQKVFEEAPAPGMTEQRRKAMGEAAVAAAKAVGYVGAGTVEFIVEGEQFYFMEMNTRLQVEHPVTEAITGIDLVEWQLRIASGERLPKLQDELAIVGHAIEARVYAEDPEKGFLPAIGTLERLKVPTAQHFTPGRVRIDAGVREGDTISPFYDPMIAKLIVHAPSREQALAQLREALSQFHVLGLTTNLSFLARVAANEAFVRGGVSTKFIEEQHAALFPAPQPVPEAALLAVALHDLGEADRNDPWAQKSSIWVGQPSVGSVHRYFSEHAAASGTIEIELRGTPPQVRFRCAGGPWKSATVRKGPDDWWVDIDGMQSQVFVLDHACTRAVQIGHERWYLLRVDLYAPPRTDAADSGHLRAPMPGTVIAVNVVVGQVVEAGAALMVIEAMKMEHTIRAPKAGRVAAIHFKVGELVKEGAELIELESTAP